MKTMKKMVVLMMAILMISSMVMTAGCFSEEVKAKSYTLKDATAALGNNWNPHTWETNADDDILGYLSLPFVDMSIKDSENGVYQWVYEMAESVTDVTASHKQDLAKYGVTLPAGKTAAEVDSGFVFEIALNKNAKWENGEKITADDYIYSMQQLLNPKMKNYRANLYVAGESALAGAAKYYNSGSPIYDPIVPYYGEDDKPDYTFDLDANKTYIHLTSGDMTLAGYSFADIKGYGYIRDIADADGNVVAPGATYYAELAKQANAFGYIEVTEDNYEKVLLVMDQYLSAFNLSIYAGDEVAMDLYMEFLFYFTGEYGEEASYDVVGCYKVDDYKIVYVNQTYIDFNYFMTSLTSTWLVYEPYYENNKSYEGELVTTSYGTSVEKTMSYGVYKLESYEASSQIVFVQNENWYGFERDKDGNLVSYTNFLVDGKKVQQYQTTKIVVNVLTEDAMKQSFFKGELSSWSPSANELPQFALSDNLYKVDETYTMSFFFNTDLNVLKTLDVSGGNQNGVVLSNTNFRKAMSLAIDRAKFVTATAGYKPAYSLLNDLYFYDVYNNPESKYRSSDEAMQAICNLYGVGYGEGTPYATLKDAYDSINGYNLTEAKALMKTACEELVAAGLYTAGSNIKVNIAWTKGPIESNEEAQIKLINEFVNAALVGSGFGSAEFIAVGSIEDRYSAVPEGEYAIGYGAWGGAAFYPFRNFQVYMDSDQYSINEAGCWDPATEVLTLEVDGEEVTMTYKNWSNCMIGSGVYSEADFSLKLSILAQLEEDYLKKYYRIPLCGTTACFLTSYQIGYYTENYNIMYGFGGLRLMHFNKDDAEWAKFVKDNDGNLKYN